MFVIPFPNWFSFVNPLPLSAIITSKFFLSMMFTEILIVFAEECFRELLRISLMQKKRFFRICPSNSFDKSKVSDFVQINLIKKEGDRSGYITICINEIWANLWKHKDAKHEV